METDLDRGRRVYQRSSWREAYSALSEADAADALGPEDVELLARAAYMLGRDDEYVAALERSYEAWVAAGEPARAVRSAFWIGHSLMLRGFGPESSGWFARAHRTLEPLPGECAEHGYLLIPMWLQQMGSGDYEAGHATAVTGEHIGQRHDDQDLIWLARDDQARALLNMGRVEEGLRLVDEVLIAAATGDLSPIVTGIVYCNTISFCRDTYTLPAVREATTALRLWCDRQPDMVTHNALCLVHRAEILQLEGSWTQALDEAGLAVSRYADGVLNQIACGAALYIQGEIHRLLGNDAEAEEAYRRASMRGREPQPGLSLLRFAQGNIAAASASIQRVMGETTDPLQRANLLPAYVEIMLGAGDTDAARSATRELSKTSDEHPSEILQAHAEHARGAMLLADGDPSEALAPLRRTIALWRELHATYEVARARLLVAAACGALGDDDTAAMETDAARRAFSDLGARRDLEKVNHRERRPAVHGLTGRELEILGRVASGKSNREIAADLVISEHTVARHLQNIFAKLGVASRTAAGAFAFEHGLVDRARTQD